MSTTQVDQEPSGGVPTGGIFFEAAARLAQERFPQAGPIIDAQTIDHRYGFIVGYLALGLEAGA